MPITDCQNCGGVLHWYWEEAFAKFGFGDGDGQVETDTVADALRDADYEVIVEDWGLHNMLIASIRKDGAELIPQTDIRFGYDNPREYLPKALLEFLDAAFPSDGDPYWLF